MELRDKNGLTEREFLASYNPDKYPKPSVTADVAIFVHSGEQWQLLLIRRGGHPYLGRLALPGGFANRNERLEDTAARELMEETGITGISMVPVGVFSKPGRDPRGWVVTSAYAAVVEGKALRAQAADDAADAQWYPVSYDRKSDTVTLVCGGEQITLTGGKANPPDALAFDHEEIIAEAVRKVFP